MDSNDAERHRQKCLLLQQPQDDEKICHRGVYKINNLLPAAECPLSDIREFLVTNLGEVEDKQFQLSEP
jgi:hypothetical protein